MNSERRYLRVQKILGKIPYYNLQKQCRNHRKIPKSIVLASLLMLRCNYCGHSHKKHKAYPEHALKLTMKKSYSIEKSPQYCYRCQCEHAFSPDQHCREHGDAIVENNASKSCFNCGQTGHLGHECTSPKIAEFLCWSATQSRSYVAEEIWRTSKMNRESLDTKLRYLHSNRKPIKSKYPRANKGGKPKRRGSSNKKSTKRK